MQNRRATIGIVLLSVALAVSGCGPQTAGPSPEPSETAAHTPEPGETAAPTVRPTALPTVEQPFSHDSDFARDTALAYIAGHYPAQAPGPDLVWLGENLTPEGLIGAVTYQYSAAGQVITVQYPMANPSETIYEVAVENLETGFRWEGKVHAGGQVTETASMTSEPLPPAQVSDADLAALVRDNSTFAFDLYQVLREKEGNLFYSPYSISLALAMTYAGARDETERQMAETLHFGLPQQRLHPAFQALYQQLASRGEGAEGMDGEGFRLHIVNDLWGQEGYDFLPRFLELVADNYGAGLRLLDFVGSPEKARATINDWISEQTEGRIENLLPQGVIDPLTVLVLTNAIYFNAAWAEPFEPKMTQDAPFYLADGGEITVPMMKKVGTTPYAEGENYQAVELPYSGGQLSMIVLLPKPGAFASFEESLEEAEVAAIVQELTPSHVALFLPRFEYGSGFSLSEALADLGMSVAFSDEADFSGMTGARDLAISEVIHKAFVSLDEAGTEAAAATAVVMSRTSMPEESFTFRADRPFLFLIRDIETGAILFVGRVLDPTAS